MSRLPLKRPHIDYNPHVLHDEEDYTWDKDVDSNYSAVFWASKIEELQALNTMLSNHVDSLNKEVADLTSIMRVLQEDNELLRNQLFNRNRI